MRDALDRWWTDRAASFSIGQAHEENLAYLLGGQFDPAAAWEQLVQSFLRVVALAQAADDVALVRAVYFLVDGSTRRTPRPELDRVDEQRSARPPSLVLLGDLDESAWKASFEMHAEDVPVPDGMPPGTAIRYEHSRPLRAPDGAPYQRSLTLERRGR